MGPQTKIAPWRRLARGGCVLMSMLSGCCCMGGLGGGEFAEGGAGDPGSNPAPNGTYVTMWLDEHASRAEASDFTIYLNEWYLGGTDLGPYGLHHLGDIARRLQEVPFPVVIEPHLDSQLNETRRQIVVTALTNHGFGDADSRVVIAYPQAEGLYGEEGVNVFYDMFQNRSGYSSNINGIGSARRGGSAFGNYGAGGFGNGGGGGGYGGGGYGGYGGGGYGGFGGGGFGGGYGGFGGGYGGFGGGYGGFGGAGRY